MRCMRCCLVLTVLNKNQQMCGLHRRGGLAIGIDFLPDRKALVTWVPVSKLIDGSPCVVGRTVVSHKFPGVVCLERVLYVHRCCVPTRVGPRTGQGSIAKLAIDFLMLSQINPITPDD